MTTEAAAPAVETSPAPSRVAEGATRSYVARPRDNRCDWWERLATPAAVLSTDPASVDGAKDLPGAYVKRNSDHEVEVWTVIFDAEADHHRKARGVWTHTVGLVTPVAKDNGEPSITWIVVEAAPQKAKIKAAGARHLLGGSGHNAAMLRLARWILEGQTDDERLSRLAVFA